MDVEILHKNLPPQKSNILICAIFIARQNTLPMSKTRNRQTQ